jgi:MFS family permease
MIIHQWSWAWIFWLNVPIGLASAAGFIVYLREAPRSARPSIDVLGAILFTVAIGAFMMSLTYWGTSNGEEAALSGIACVVFAVLFVLQERRAAEPMISFGLWSRRPIAAANAATVASGMVLMGATTFLPMYVQGVLGRSPVIAGLALTMMMVGWPTGATIAARSFHRFGLRAILVAGSVFVPLGVLFFALLTPHSSPVLAGLGSLVAGFGMGLSSVSSLVLIQEIVDTDQRGSATASNLFSRNLGSTLGATAFGAALNYGLSHSTLSKAITSEQLRQLLDARRLAEVSEPVVRLVLHESLHLTFWAMLAIAVLIVLFSTFVPHVALGRGPAPALKPVKE